MYEPLDFVTMGQRWVMRRNLIGQELNLCVGPGRSAVGPRMSRTRPMQAMKATPDLSCPRSHRFRGEIRSSFFMLFPGPCRRGAFARRVERCSGQYGESMEDDRAQPSDGLSMADLCARTGPGWIRIPDRSGQGWLNERTGRKWRVRSLDESGLRHYAAARKPSFRNRSLARAGWGP